jgi:Dolichyl-phosphate-mannose-protein mannosyltransferase
LRLIAKTINLSRSGALASVYFPYRNGPVDAAQAKSSNPGINIGRTLTACWFGAFVGIWLYCSWGWPMIGDANLIRYVVLAGERHLAPYREIHDINMPGTYLLDWVTLHLFGPGATGIRIYDCILLAFCTAGMSFIAGQRNRSVGFCAGCLFALFHARDGYEELGQRDLAIAALLIFAIDSAVSMLRKGSKRASFCYGLSIGFACAIKPTAIVFLLTSIPLFQTPNPYNRKTLFKWAGIGFGLPVAALLMFLRHHRAIHSFLQMITVELPYHALLGEQPVSTLLRLLFAPSVAVWLACVISGCWWFQDRSVKERIALWGIVAGVLNYLLQLRGFNYHRYPFVAALIVSLALFLIRMLESESWRYASGISLAIYCAVLAPLFVRASLKRPLATPPGLAQLESDLDRGSKNATYQCIDTIEGCIAALTHADRHQVTGEMYDEFFFHDSIPAALETRRRVFLNDLIRNPPTVIVVAMGLFPETDNGYQKLSQWPSFGDWLTSCYSLRTERFFPETRVSKSFGYRLYDLSTQTCYSTYHLSSIGMPETLH